MVAAAVSSKGGPRGASEQARGLNFLFPTYNLTGALAHKAASPPQKKHFLTPVQDSLLGHGHSGAGERSTLAMLGHAPISGAPCGKHEAGTDRAASKGPVDRRARVLAPAPDRETEGPTAVRGHEQCAARPMRWRTQLIG